MPTSGLPDVTLPRWLRASPPGWTATADVIVVGSGIAGLTTALRLRRRVDRVHQLYAKIDYSPLMTMNIHSQGTSNLNGNEEVTASNDSTTSTNNTARAVNSDTPQTMLSGDEDYASGAVDTNSQSSVTGNVGSSSNATNTAENTSDNLVTGFQGNASRLVMEYRASLINVDMQVIGAIADCFMMILNSGDDYFTHENGWYN